MIPAAMTAESLRLATSRQKLWSRSHSRGQRKNHLAPLRDGEQTAVGGRGVPGKSPLGDRRDRSLSVLRACVAVEAPATSGGPAGLEALTGDQLLVFSTGTRRGPASGGGR
jgi:hypothetical protein